MKVCIAILYALVKMAKAINFYVHADNATRFLYRNTYRFLKERMEKECEALCIKKPFLIVAPMSGKTDGTCINGRVVVVDPCKTRNIMQTFRHELRHAWQYRYQRDLFDWCWIYLHPRTKKDTAWYWLDLSEMDARYYSMTCDVHGPINDITVSQAQKMLRGETYLQEMHALAYAYGVLPRSLA